MKTIFGSSPDMLFEALMDEQVRSAIWLSIYTALLATIVGAVFGVPLAYLLAPRAREADGIVIDGGSIGGGRVDAQGDHRVAMAFAVASVAASSPVSISGADVIRTSFPDFLEVARAAGLHIEAENE